MLLAAPRLMAAHLVLGIISQVSTPFFREIHFLKKFYFIFKVYNIVLVLPNIEMNPPQVYMCSPSWTLLPPLLPFLNPAWTSGSSRFTYCWSLAWRILSITWLACEWVQLCSSLSILWHCLSLGLEWKLTFSSPVAAAEFSKFAGLLRAALS